MRLCVVWVLCLLHLSCVAREARALTVVTEVSPPAVVMGSDGPAGAAVEIVREIQRRVGDNTPIEVLPWARAYAMAQEMPDVVIFCLTRTSEREALFEWVGPLFAIDWLFVGLEGMAPVVASLDDARKVRAIGTYKDDAREEFLLAHGFRNLDSAPDAYVNIRKLHSGRVDLVVTTTLGFKVMAAMAEAHKAPLRKVYAFKRVELGIAFSRGSDPAKVAAWRKAYEAMRADGSFEAIYSRWLPGEALPW